MMVGGRGYGKVKFSSQIKAKKKKRKVSQINAEGRFKNKKNVPQREFPSNLCGQN